MTEMFADSEEGFQRDYLQCDNFSSSSSGSESQKHETAPKELFSTLPELNIYDDKKFDEQATTSSAIAVPSSSNLDVRNEENLQVLQSPGSQDQTSSHVQITGGEFVGAHFGPQTTHQHQNIKVEKLEQSQHVHHHHYYPSEQGTSSNEPVGATGYKSDQQQQDVTEEPSTSSGEVELCRFIKLFPQRRISENICYGEQISKLTGTRPLAIKFIHYKKKKLLEAKILNKVNSHHNVVSIVHSDVYQQHAFKYIYIAMELCHKQDLHDHVTENKNNNVPFDPQLSISQAKQLVEGLNHIHSNDIIHRDLKPHNVLFSLDKKTFKIADFGISKEMTSGRTVTFVTNAQAGTDGYRAPETYNSNEMSKQADIFSLGLVIYFLWSNGHHAFGDDPDDWNRNIKKNKKRDLSRLLLPDKEPAIDLLEWMLRVEPRERPTVGQILRHQIFGGKEKNPTSTSDAATPTNLGATPANLGATSSNLGATPASSGATSSNLGATPASSGATPTDMKYHPKYSLLYDLSTRTMTTTRGRCPEDVELLQDDERVEIRSVQQMDVEEGQQRFIGDQVIGGRPGVGARFCAWFSAQRMEFVICFVILSLVAFTGVVFANTLASSDELSKNETTLPPITASSNTTTSSS